MRDQHLHNCILCKKQFKCMTTYTHAGDNAQEVYDCQGDYESFCDKHPVEDMYKWFEDRGEFDNLPPINPEIVVMYKKYGITVG